MLRLVSPANLSIRGRFRLRSLISLYPRLFLPVMRRRPAHRGHIVDVDTEIMIEGYPRSGNTFAVVAFEFAQGDPCGSPGIYTPLPMSSKGCIEVYRLWW